LNAVSEFASGSGTCLPRSSVSGRSQDWDACVSKVACHPSVVVTGTVVSSQSSTSSGASCCGVRLWRAATDIHRLVWFGVPPPTYMLVASGQQCCARLMVGGDRGVLLGLLHFWSARLIRYLGNSGAGG
jgi:hypothetical protein